MTIFEHNEGAIELADSPIRPNCTTHISIRYRIVREKVCKQILKIGHVEYEKQAAECLTKNLPEATLVSHSKSWNNLLNE